jgi:hypothetical protein
MISLQQKAFPKKSGVYTYLEFFSTEQYRIWMNTSRGVSPNSSLTWMKLAFRIGRIANRGRLSYRRRCAAIRYIIKYLRLWNIFH